MLSDNIRNYRKKNNLSQEELAEKVGVSRQSISFWETGQTQPTIDNIITLAKIFNISSDMLLGNTDNINIPVDNVPGEKPVKKKKKWPIAVIIIAGVLLVGGVICGVLYMNDYFGENSSDNKNNSSAVQSTAASVNSTVQAAPNKENNASKVVSTQKPNNTASKSEGSKKPVANTPSTGKNNNTAGSGNSTSTPTTAKFDLFTYCKNFAIEKGTLNGDYCIYQQPSTKYGGYENEYFSISYWGDSDMVEFCLHCPLDDTLSHNFYLRMRGGYNKKYEYLSSKYYRDSGESMRSATGYIDPAVFSDKYPISCDNYEGDFDGQNQFMEDTRVGMCDLISCLKKFVTTEGMECDFSAFDFVNF